MEAQTTTTTEVATTTATNSKPTNIQFNIDKQCPIQYVTVYNDRAEVTRLLNHHFDVEGTYELVFEGFSPFVDLTSLHVSGGTGKACTILEVSYQTRYEQTTLEIELKPLDQLQNELDLIQKEIGTHQRELTRITKQRTWLEGRATKLMNQNEKNEPESLNTMEQFLDFYYKTLLKLDNDTINEENQIKILTEKQTILQTKIREHGADAQTNRQKTKREVTITVHIDRKNIDISLEIAYLISNCSWSASYDVRVNSSATIKQQTQLTYYGSIVRI